VSEFLKQFLAWRGGDDRTAATDMAAAAAAAAAASLAGAATISSLDTSGKMGMV
jgi:hypothetical protein